MLQSNGNTSTSYQKNRYLYNGKELQDYSIGGSSLNWYDYCARFYDPQIGSFTAQDRFTEKYFDYSPYQYCMGNPIRFIDVNGDSIRLTKSFKYNQNLLKAHNTWLNTDAGKDFLKLFGEGGEYERIAVVIDAVNPNSLTYFGAAGEEKLYIINSEDSPIEIKVGLVSKDVANTAKGNDENSYLRFTLKFANTAYEEDNSKVEVIDTQTHESQHAIISLASILRLYNKPSANEQNDLMENKSGQYFKTRFNNFMQIKSLWIVLIYVKIREIKSM
jgi:RHS repeat-associated protein